MPDQALVAKHDLLSTEPRGERRLRVPDVDEGLSNVERRLERRADGSDRFVANARVVHLHGRGDVPAGCRGREANA